MGGAGGAGQPANGDTVYLTQTSASDVTCYYYNQLYPGATLSGLRIDGTGGGGMTLDQGFGGTNYRTLQSLREDVGYDGVGSHTQSAGTNSVQDSLNLGWNSGSNGSYSLSQGTLWANNVNVGVSGTGTFTQTGGSHTVGDTLAIAGKAGSSGLYSLKNGMLNSGNNFQVDSGGTFQQTGGIVDGSSNTIVLIEGTYNLSQGSVNNLKQIGISTHNGNFNQIGGIVDGNSNTLLFTEGTCTVAGDGSVRNVREATVRNGGNFYLKDQGSLWSPSQLNVNYGGTFQQTGGIVDGNSNTIALIEGTYNLSQGSVNNLKQIAISTHNGNFNQTGGIVDGNSNTLLFTEGTCTVAGDGSVRNVREATVRNGGKFYLKDQGSLWSPSQLNVNYGGTFQQTGGIVDGNSNTIALIEGTYNLSQGSVNNLKQIAISTHNGNFNQTGGIVDGNSNTLLFTEGTCTVAGDGSVRNVREATVRNGGNFYLKDQGSLWSPSQLNVNYGGTFQQTGGIVDGNSNTIALIEGTYNLSQGSVNNLKQIASEPTTVISTRPAASWMVPVTLSRWSKALIIFLVMGASDILMNCGSGQVVFLIFPAMAVSGKLKM